jgi:calcium-binding protein CML
VKDSVPSSRRAASQAELRREFKRVDVNRDGRIDLAEFEALLIGLEAGMSHEEMRTGFHDVDTDKDGRIDVHEFIEWWDSD